MDQSVSIDELMGPCRSCDGLLMVVEMWISGGPLHKAQLVLRNLPRTCVICSASESVFLIAPLLP